MCIFRNILATALAAQTVACSAGGSAECRQISRVDAIKLATAAKQEMRVREEDRPNWSSNTVMSVELNDGRGFGALVQFQGDGAKFPVAFIYEDCVVGWSVQP
jgi:hypothetical protein